MLLQTKNRKVNLVLKTRKIISVCLILKNKKFEDAFFKSYQDGDLEALVNIIYTLAEDEDGKIIFTNTGEVEDFLDEYKKENNKTYSDIYKELAEAINAEGFFMKKMSKKELEEMISNPLSSTNMNELIQRSAEKAVDKIAQEQFIGYKA